MEHSGVGGDAVFERFLRVTETEKLESWRAEKAGHLV